MEVSIGSIVEGHGECSAVPVLIRRIAERVDPGLSPKVLPPIRKPADRLRKPGELERAIEFAARKLNGHGGILVLIDADWNGACPAKDGPILLARAKNVRNEIPISVVLARMEYEAWFLASAESLRGRRGLPNNLTAPEAPESIRGAKGWLSRHMPSGQSYSETEDQAAFSSIFDLDLARRARSFDKCYREIYGMLQTLCKGIPE